MTDTHAEPPLSPGQRKSTLVAVALLIMFMVSATAMVWSGLQLWRGEQLGAAYRLLPSGCDRVVIVDDPIAATTALQLLATRGGLPAMWRDTPTRLHGWLAGATASKAWDRGATWGICEQQGRGYAVLPLAQGIDLSAAASATSAWLDGWSQATDGAARGLRWSAENGRWAARDGDGRLRAALRLATDGETTAVQLAWQQTATTPATGGDAHAWLDTLQALPASRSLQHDQAARESAERVGGGALHMYLSAPTMQELARRWIASGGEALQPWREGATHFSWLGLVVRADRGKLAVHIHCNGNQAATSFLKAHFDTYAELDGATVLPAAVAERPLWGVLRSGPRGWGMLAEVDPAAAALALHFPGDRGTALQTWETLLAGPVAWIGQDGCLLAIAQLRQPTATALPAGLPPALPIRGCPATVRRKVGSLLVSGPAARVEAAASWLQGPQSARLEGTEVDADRRRLLADTQGWRAESPHAIGTPLQGPAQFEWVWVDTGLAVGIHWPLP